MSIPILLLALAIVIAPIKAALPDEALWSPIVVALILVAAAWECVRQLRGGAPPVPRVIALVVGGYVAWAALSLLWQWLGVNHGRPTYMDAMIRALAYWLAGAVLVIYLQPALRQRPAMYACVGALVAGATIAAYMGLQDYLIHVAKHQAIWREYGTSTPDYFAGFLVLTIPVTLALFIAAPDGESIVAPLVYAMALAPQIAVLPATGSRFALVTLAVSVAVVIAAFLLARRTGSSLTRAQVVRIVIVLLLVLGAAAVVAKPVAHRLNRAVAAEQQHSGSFQIWTWRGALHMAERYPVFGSGPGTFAFSYQKHALVGYTRVAHNSYLQAADEIGIPGTVLLLAGLLMIAWTGVRALSLPRGKPGESEPPRSGKAQSGAHGTKTMSPSSLGAWMLSRFGARDDKLLLCGLMGGLAAGLLQNGIDSDWYFTFDGITLWLIAALILAVSSKPEDVGELDGWKKSFCRLFALKGAVWCAILGAAMIVWAGAESQATLATSEERSVDPGAASLAYSMYQTAMMLNPLRADYPIHRGLVVDPVADPSSVEPDLRRAVYLEPSGVNYRRLGTYLLSQRRPADALAAAETGLSIEPAFTNLWNLAAQANLAMGDAGAAKRDYERAAAIEVSPIGTILAITEVVSIDYVDADLYLGDDAMRYKDFGLAARYYRRVERKLGQYAAEGGSTNDLRMAQIGDRPNSALDTQMRDDYIHGATGLIKALSALNSPDAAVVQGRYSSTAAQFDRIIQKAASAPAPS